jgi:hypothetical protein
MRGRWRRAADRKVWFRGVAKPLRNDDDYADLK